MKGKYQILKWGEAREHLKEPRVPIVVGREDIKKLVVGTLKGGFLVYVYYRMALRVALAVTAVL